MALFEFVKRRVLTDNLIEKDLREIALAEALEQKLIARPVGNGHLLKL